MHGLENARVVCGICGQVLHFVAPRGFLHPNRSIYCVKCARCEHLLLSQVLLAICPSCGRPTSWVYDHSSDPVRIDIHA